VSLTILEAMAAGLPVVATPVGGNPEVVVDQETGLLVPARARALAEAVSGLLHDPRRRRVMGDAARWRVIRHFSIARMVDDYARAYLGSRDIAPPPEVEKLDAAAPPVNAPITADTISVSDAMRSTV